MVESFAPLPPLPAEVPEAGGQTVWRTVGQVLTAKDDPSLGVFDILNVFRRKWFLSRSHLLANVLSAQKLEDGLISWVEFSPPLSFPPGQVRSGACTTPCAQGETGDVCFHFRAA